MTIGTITNGATRPTQTLDRTGQLESRSVRELDIQQEGKNKAQIAKTVGIVALVVFALLAAIAFVAGGIAPGGFGPNGILSLGLRGVGTFAGKTAFWTMITGAGGLGLAAIGTTAGCVIGGLKNRNAEERRP